MSATYIKKNLTNIRMNSIINNGNRRNKSNINNFKIKYQQQPEITNNLSLYKFKDSPSKFIYSKFKTNNLYKKFSFTNRTNLRRISSNKDFNQHSSNNNIIIQNLDKNNSMNNQITILKCNSKEKEKIIQNIANNNMSTKYQKKKDIILCKESNLLNNLIKTLHNLWDSLHVLKPYRELFNVLISQLDEKNKIDYINNEITEISELKNDIETLVCVITMRINTLKSLNEMNKKLKLILKSENEETNELLVKNMSNKIEKLRQYTICICFYMKKIKNIIYESKRYGKYDMDIIAYKYLFDKNYIIKMREEMSFLKEGNAKYFFNVLEDQTPFLLKASEEDPNANGDPFIHLVPITEETKEKIKKCQFIIYQELIAYQNCDSKGKNFRAISPMRKFEENKSLKFKEEDINIEYINNNIDNFKNDNNFIINPIEIKNRKMIFQSGISKKKRSLTLKTEDKNIKKILVEEVNKKNSINNLIVCNNINTTIIGGTRIVKKPEKKLYIPNIHHKNKMEINSNSLLYSNSILENNNNNNNNNNISKAFNNSSNSDGITQVILEVVFYKKSINKFQSKYYNDYFKKLPRDQIYMFNLKKNLQSSLINGIAPCLILIKDKFLPAPEVKNKSKKIIYGVCGLYYIYNIKNNLLTLKISHISSLADPDCVNYQQNLNLIYEKLFEFIKEEFYFDEICIEYNEEQVNKEIMDLFINNFQFEIKERDVEASKVMKEKIKLNNAVDLGSQVNGQDTILETEETEQFLIFRNTLNNNLKEKIIKIVQFFTNKNIFNIFNALIISNSTDSIDDKNNKSFDDTYINILSVNHLTNKNVGKNTDAIYNNVTSLDQLMKIFFQYNITSDELPLSIAENRFDILSDVINKNIHFNFSNSYIFNNFNIYNPTSYLDKSTNIFYNIIKAENIYVMFSQKFQLNIYHIINNNMAIFFAEINNSPLKKFIFNKNIYIQLNELYNDFLNNQIIGVLKNKIIWIPCFSQYRHFKCKLNDFEHIVHEYVKISNPVIVPKNKEQLKQFDVFFKSQIYHPFSIEPELSTDIKIDTNFIFGIINNAGIIKDLAKKEKKKSEIISGSINDENSANDLIDLLGNKENKDSSSSNKININRWDKDIKEDKMPYVIFASYIEEKEFKKRKKNNV